MGFLEDFGKYVPRRPGDGIAWDGLQTLFAATCFADMRSTPQDPAYHGEGDVYAHTQRVCATLADAAAFHALPPHQKSALFLAALFHDIGKIKTTRLDSGRWVSPHHAATGSRIVREYLWNNCGLCGSREATAFRETVCALVRYHMLPVHLIDQEDPERRARETAAVGELAAGFSWQLLCLQAEADIKGRVAADVSEGLARVSLAKMLTAEAGCLCGPAAFADAFTKRAYLSGRNVAPGQRLYDDSWGEVVMLSGLPGTGKDTWIQAHCPELPMLSLDGLRHELRVKPTENQGAVVQTAQARARALLREKRPFVWNATNLTPDTRQRWIGLFERYGARVRIVYLETDTGTRAARNLGRREAVPESAVARMLEKLVPPMPWEAQTVEWIYT